jgi:hypothetical protein
VQTNGEAKGRLELTWKKKESKRNKTKGGGCSVGVFFWDGAGGVACTLNRGFSECGWDFFSLLSSQT